MTSQSHCNFGHGQTDQGLGELSLVGHARTYYCLKNMLVGMAFTANMVVVVAAMPYYICKVEYCSCFVLSKGKSESTV